MALERTRPPAPFSARLILWIVLIFLYLPIALMLLGAFVDSTEGITLKWFFEVVQDDSLMRALGNSLLVAFSASALATCLGTFAALGLFRASGKMQWALRSLSTASLIFPEIVFALSLLSWFFILGFNLGLGTVIVAHVTFSLSYVLMAVGARLANLEESLEDAARDLGAGEWRLIQSILLPQLKPAIWGGFVLSFLLSFDDFLITYFVNGIGQDTLPIKLYTAMKMGVSPKLNALSSLMFLFTLAVLVVLFRSRSFKSFLQPHDKTKSGN